MSPFWSHILLILPLLGLTDAIAFRAPAATLARDDYESAMPDPTPGVDINTIARLQRRDTTSSSDSDISDGSWTYSFYEATTQSYLSGSSNVCGWVDGNLNAGTIECIEGFSCVFHSPDSEYPGLAGCCSGTYCGFETTCVNYTQYTATPELLSSAGAFTMFCSDPATPACVTWTYPDQTVTDFGCGATPYISKVYTSATPGYVTASIEVIESVWLSTVDDDFLRTYESSWSSTSGATSAQAATVVHVTSQAASHTTSKHPTATSNNSHSHSSSSSSPSTGAIAGGVVGGVVGAAAVSALAMFYFMRRRNAKRADDEDPSSRGQVRYQSIAADQPRNYEMQPSSGLGSTEQESKVSEAPGSVPADRAHEMESSTERAHEMDSTDSRGFVAELPADYVAAQKGTDYDTKNG